MKHTKEINEQMNHSEGKTYPWVNCSTDITTSSKPFEVTEKEKPWNCLTLASCSQKKNKGGAS